MIFPDVEVLDFCGPFEVFSVTRLDDAKRARDARRPSRCGSSPRRATSWWRPAASGSCPIARSTTCPPLDVLVVPGGWGTRRCSSTGRCSTGSRPAAARCRRSPRSAPARSALDASGYSTAGTRPRTGARSICCARVAPRATVEDALHVVEDGHVLTVGRHLGRDRHVAPPGGAALRRAHRSRDGAAHGVSLSGGQPAPRAMVA